MVTCPDCEGRKTIYEVVNIHTGDTLRVTPLAYMMQPENEDAALQQGQNYCKWGEERCPTCYGEGVIPDE